MKSEYNIDQLVKNSINYQKIIENAMKTPAETKTPRPKTQLEKYLEKLEK